MLLFLIFAPIFFFAFLFLSSSILPPFLPSSPLPSPPFLLWAIVNPLLQKTSGLLHLSHWFSLVNSSEWWVGVWVPCLWFFLQSKQGFQFLMIFINSLHLSCPSASQATVCTSLAFKAHSWHPMCTILPSYRIEIWINSAKFSQEDTFRPVSERWHLHPLPN